MILGVIFFPVGAQQCSIGSSLFFPETRLEAPRLVQAKRILQRSCKVWTRLQCINVGCFKRWIDLWIHTSQVTDFFLIFRLGVRYQVLSSWKAQVQVKSQVIYLKVWNSLWIWDHCGTVCYLEFLKTTDIKGGCIANYKSRSENGEYFD